jgi:hypothetical protein
MGGVLGLNALFLAVGSTVVWGARGWRRWTDYLWLGGVAYVCGLSAVCVIGTLVLIFGGGMSTAAILVPATGVGVAGIAIGLVRRHRLPPFTRPRFTGTAFALAPTALAALVVAMLVQLTRVGRMQALTSWDAWAFWLPKAKAIYFFGGLDEHLFRTLAGPSYPLLVPTLDAMNFRFMGSADTRTLAVQYALLAVGLVWAAAGLLRRLAPASVTWLFLATALVLPALDDRLFERTGDWPLDIFFALTSLSLLAWILTKEDWLLVPYCLTFAAMIATKREGALLAACLVVGGVATAGWRTRRAWLGVVGVAALAYLPNIPWRLWWSSRGLQSDAPPGGFLHGTFGHPDRVWPSFRLVLHLLFDYQLWLGVAPIALVAAVLCLRALDRRPAVFFLITFALGVVGWAWVNWSDPTYPLSDAAINPTRRAVGSLVLLSIVAAPVLIGQLLAQRSREPAAEPVAAS